jgi:hypothetical protein
VVGLIWKIVRCDLAEYLKTAAKIGSFESRVGIGAQSRGRFGDSARFALDLSLELDCRVGKIIPLEGFICRQGS